MAENVNFTGKDNSFRLVIRTNVDDEDLMIEFDRVDESTISTTSDITNHPLVTGDMIADHMYRNPITMSVTGSFSLNGNKPTTFPGSSDRLSNIETLFEKIKNKGAFCELVKMSRANDSSTRFLVRKNMVLTSITWTERQNSLNFSFNFTEAITANVQTVEYDIDVTDSNLPAITDASTLDFTDTLLDWQQIDEIVTRQLYDVGLVTAEFLQYAVDTAKAMAAGTLVGAVAGIVVGYSVLIGISLAVGSIPVAGWIAAGIIVAVGFIVGLFIGLFQGIKKAEAQRKYKVQAFELYEDDRRNQQEVERFANYIGSIHQNLEYLEDVMQVYGIASNENQECMTYIDDKYYIFTFTKNNTSGKYGLVVKDIEDKVVASMPVIDGLTNIGECTRSNCLFRTSDGGFFIYLINLKAEEAINDGKSQEEIDEINNDLTSYAIFVSQTDMEQFNSMISEIVVNAMTV